MDRKVIELPGGHKGFRIRMESVTERDEQASVFVHPIPRGFRPAWRWTDDMTMEVGLVPIAEAKPGNKPEEDAPPAGTDDLRAELLKLSIEELKTRAAELGITVAGAAKKPALVGLLVDKLQQPAQTK